MRIGVLGGMFDPIHKGHLRAAENAARGARLDRVLFVPAGVPPHRDLPRASPFDRYAMVALATLEAPTFVPWDGELRREGPSYTVDTLRSVQADHDGAEVVLIVGSDNLPLLPTWKDPEAIVALAEIAVVGRPGSGAAEAPRGAKVVEVEGTGLPIASREVRARLRNGDAAEELLPPAVRAYIGKRRLYR